MMAYLPAGTDVRWHKSPELFKATLKFHEDKARTPESLKIAKAMHTAMIEEIFTDFRSKEISQRLEFTGSAYEGVKVKKCEGNDDLEFDVMVVLKVPGSCKLKSDSLCGKAGFSFIKCLNVGQVSSCWFSENCLSTEAEDCLVDASRTVNRFFGELQQWINESRKYNGQILLRRHGPAVQMDVYKEKVTSDPPYYSVDVVPAIEIQEPCATRLHVAKPLKNRGMPDSVTWRRLTSIDTVFRYGYSDERVHEYTPSHFRCMTEFELLLNTKYLFSRIGHEIDTETGNDLEFKVLVVNESHCRELQLDQVPEKPEFYWIVPTKNHPTTERLNKSLKNCYRPCGLHLDSRRATTHFVDDLQECFKKSTLLNGKVHIRRDGPVVRLLVCELLAVQVQLEGRVQRSSKKSSIPTPLYYVDLVFAHKINGDLYTARPLEEKNEHDAKAWRTSFSLDEKKELYGIHGCLKKVFRVCKVLRNTEVGLAQLTSYHLKTTLFWQKRKSDWSDKCIGERLMNVIGELEHYLESRNLPHFFLKDLNLTSGMINDCMKHMQNRLFRLYTGQRHMLKVLGVPWNNPQINEAVREIDNKLKTTNQAVIESLDLNSVVRSAIDKLLNNCYRSASNLEDGSSWNIYNVIRTDDDDDADFYAIFVISDYANDLEKQNTLSLEGRSYSCRLASRNAVASNPNLRRNMTMTFLDATKTASFVADVLTRLMNADESCQFVNARAEGSFVKIRSLIGPANCPDLTMIPAYRADDKLFIAADGKGDSLEWRQSHFLEERRCISATPSGCGLRVLHILKFLRSSECELSGLNMRHFRAALLWELHDQSDWAENKMAERLLDVMDRLYFAVTVNLLEDYFNPGVNVLSDLNQCLLPNLLRFLKNFCENEDKQVIILRVRSFFGRVGPTKAYHERVG